MKRAKKQIKTGRPKKKEVKGAPTDRPVTGIYNSGPVEQLDRFDLEPGPKVRFEATIHPGRKARSADWVDHLNIDRVPGPNGEVRALLKADECVRLLNQGYEIRLHHAHPVRPLNPALIETDESVRRWLDKELRGIPRFEGPKGSKGYEDT